jgi:hypothetical protein
MAHIGRGHTAFTLRDNEPLYGHPDGTGDGRLLPRLARSACGWAERFTEAEEVAEAHVMVLSARMWRQFFDSDPAAVGRVVALNEEPYTIIGILPGQLRIRDWDSFRTRNIPLSRKDYCCGRLGQLDAVARIAPGVVAGAGGEQSWNQPPRGWRWNMRRPMQAGVPRSYHSTKRRGGQRREPLLLLVCACLAVLAIACANVAGAGPGTAPQPVARDGRCVRPWARTPTRSDPAGLRGSGRPLHGWGSRRTAGG